jgi:hypothetical protein
MQKNTLRSGFRQGNAGGNEAALRKTIKKVVTAILDSSYGPMEPTFAKSGCGLEIFLAMLRS